VHAIDIERLEALLARDREAPVGKRVRCGHVSEPAQKRARGAVKHVIFQNDDGVRDGSRRRRIERAALDANERPRSRQLLSPKHTVAALKPGIEERDIRAVLYAHLACEI
jgi:hypothetical protein